MNKFTVLKNQDIEKYLSEEEKQQLLVLIGKLGYGRVMDNKPLNNKYAVVNLDEPYAKEVTDIMNKNKHWKNDDSNAHIKNINLKGSEYSERVCY